MVLRWRPVDRDVDVIVVGAGIVGLATALKLLQARPGLSLMVLEREDRVAAHQSSHNSGVLHAGLYYRPGSLKARLCRAGKQELEDFAAEHGIPVRRVGKVVVATRQEEVGRLLALLDRGRANGVPGLRLLDRPALAEVEPHVAGRAALHSPSTAVVDFGEVCRALAREVERRGGRVDLGEEVVGLRRGSGAAKVLTPARSLAARLVITCAGPYADRVAALTGDPGGVRIVPFRGSYLRIRPPADELVRGNVYPVPDPRLPFLGTHLTRRVGGELWAGPTVGLAGSRSVHARGRFLGPDLREALRSPGFWRLLGRYPLAAVREGLLDRIVHLHVRALRRLVPDLSAADVEPGPVGVRGQAVGRDGTLLEDFALGGDGQVLHVHNAPSPAATAALAIGGELTRRALARLEG